MGWMGSGKRNAYYSAGDLYALYSMYHIMWCLLQCTCIRCCRGMLQCCDLPMLSMLLLQAQTKVFAAQENAARHGISLLQERRHVDPPTGNVPLAHAQVHPARQLLPQLGLERAHLGLAQRARLLLLALAPAATAAAPERILLVVEALRVVLDAELVGGVAEPLVLAVALFLGKHGVGDALGEVDAGLEARGDFAIDGEHLDDVLLAGLAGGRALGVHLCGEAARGDDLVGGAEDDADAGAVAAGGAAGAVDVGVCGAGHVVVDDLVDLVDVEAAGGDVGGDEDGVALGGEALEGAEAGLLGHLRVQREDERQLEVLQEGGEAADGRDGVCEDEGAAAGVEEQDGVEEEVLRRVSYLSCSLQLMSRQEERGDIPFPSLRTQLGPP